MFFSEFRSQVWDFNIFFLSNLWSETKTENIWFLGLRSETKNSQKTKLGLRSQNFGLRSETKKKSWSQVLDPRPKSLVSGLRPRFHAWSQVSDLKPEKIVWSDLARVRRGSSAFSPLLDWVKTIDEQKSVWLGFFQKKNCFFHLFQKKTV